MAIIRCPNCDAVNAEGRNMCRICDLAFDLRSGRQKISEKAEPELSLKESTMFDEIESEFWSREIGFTPRLLAFVWFAAAAAIPVWFFYSQKIYRSLERDTLAFFLEFAAVPILSAAI